jgi:hypothetical protein
VSSCNKVTWGGALHPPGFEDPRAHTYLHAVLLEEGLEELDELLVVAVL